MYLVNYFENDIIDQIKFVDSKLQEYQISDLNIRLVDTQYFMAIDHQLFYKLEYKEDISLY